MSEIKTKEEAQAKIKELMKQQDDLEQQMVELALEFNVSLSLGDYGSGRTLIHEDGHWSGKGRGDWLYSSESC